jgi:hypothetical protein
MRIAANFGHVSKFSVKNFSRKAHTHIGTYLLAYFNNNDNISPELQICKRPPGKKLIRFKRRITNKPKNALITPAPPNLETILKPAHPSTTIFCSR